MRPRCGHHNRQMRWIPYRHHWICPRPLCPETSSEPGPRKKPRRPRPSIQIMDDGRLVLRGKHWHYQKLAVWERDGQRCVGCGKPLAAPGSGSPNEGEIHHRNTRGMQGSKRDDRMENLETRCWDCHGKVTAAPEWRA